MFNWFKKNTLPVKDVPESAVAATQGSDSITPPAISESVALKDQGNAHFENGKLDAAAACYRQAIAHNPRYAEAYTNLGYVFQVQGNLNEAVALYRKAVEFNPNLLMAHQNIGFALMNLGQADAAEESLRRVVALAPEHAGAWQSLGVIAAQRGDLPRAETLLRRALELQPDYIEAHNNLGNLLKHAKRLSEAETCYRRALELKPDYADAHYNLGSLLMEAQRLPEAEACYRRALELKPDYADAHYNLGNLFQQTRRLPEAEASYRQALKIKPDYAESQNNLGILLVELGQLNDAVANYRRALEIKPDFAEAHGNLGIALQDLGQLDDAVASYRRALQVKPDYADAHYNLGIALQDLGQLDDAVASYRRALEIKPKSLAYAAKTHLLLPHILESNEAIASWRARYQTGVSVLASGDFDDNLASLSPLSFYLAYHNQNDKPLMEALHHMLRSRATSPPTTVHQALNLQEPAGSNRRIRVGFLSEYLAGHTIGKLFQGFIRHLDRRRFEVVVIHAPKAKGDAIRQSIDAFADKVLTLPPGLKDQQASVMAECLDVLFYPDIGMNSATYFLAYARLAPVQAVSWGHPDTTGLDSMDYFVSAVSIEPPDADEHYTERLIRLNRMPCYYQPLVAPTKIPARPALDLPETGTLYGCPQSLFKFHPDFDSVLAAIAEGDPDGHIVLIEGKYASWTNLLKARWANTYPILLERVIFLSKMPLDRFMALMAHIDILLDPIHFGSGNTMYEAMVYGTPIVTWPGKFMRGRLVAGCYKQMGIKEPPVAECLEDYAKVALALGLDPERRRKLRNELLEAASKDLFADMQAVKEFEHFLVAAVNAAQRGEKLPMGWEPSCKDGILTENL